MGGTYKKKVEVIQENQLYRQYLQGVCNIAIMHTKQGGCNLSYKLMRMCCKKM